MSVNVQQRGARFQLRVKHRLLPKPFFFTFDTQADADAYGRRFHDLLDRGIVPTELLNQPAPVTDPLLAELIRGYINGAPLTESDSELLGVILAEVPGVRMSDLTALWVDAYVQRLKFQANLSPGTIRKRIGALGRVVDWQRRRTESKAENPFRSLPIGYSSYTRAEAEKLEAAGKQAKRDVKRDRRLHEGEEQAVLDTLAGVRRPDRQRAMSADPALALFFVLVLNTGMRMREVYRLRVDQIDLERRLIRVEGSKGARGAIKPRTVPIGSALLASLVEFIGDRSGLVFPFWDGTADELKRTTTRLSARFSAVFDYSGCPDLSEHDLRHEATCRWVTMRAASGGWLFSETEVCKIMGWSDPRMMLRYASLRGEDLSSRLD